MKQMKDTTIKKHVRNAFYSFQLMRAYENMDNALAEELYKKEQKNIAKHLSAIGIKKNERAEALDVFAGWYTELTDEELKELEVQAESIIKSTEDFRKALPQMIKEAEAEIKELKELSQTELYDAYVYMREHEEERSALTHAARTFVAFELHCRRDAEELEAKLERAYELGFEGRDEDPDVICFLWDEIDSGRTAEAVSIMEEECEEAEEGVEADAHTSEEDAFITVVDEAAEEAKKEVAAEADAQAAEDAAAESYTESSKAVAWEDDADDIF